MKNLTKKLNLQILEQGRKQNKKIIYSNLAWLFLSPFIAIPFGEFISEDISFLELFIPLIYFGPGVYGLFILFTSKKAKYCRVIANTLKVNIWFLRPFTKQEIQFINKHFKKIKWKSNFNLDEKETFKETSFADMEQLKEKEFDKNYIFKYMVNDEDMTKVQILKANYYWVFLALLFITYNFIL